MTTTSISGRVSSSRKLRDQRSNKNGTIVTWRTDRRLKIIGADHVPTVPFRSLPVVGRTLGKGKPHSGLLDHDAHVRALLGEPCWYRIRLLHRTYRVELAPRFGRNRRIVGVQGSATLIPVPSDPPSSARPNGPLEGREVHYSRAASRSLELAKYSADTARAQAEFRTRKAEEAQRQANLARQAARKQADLAELIADAGSALEVPHDEKGSLVRLANLLVGHIADWCVIQLAEDRLFRRAAMKVTADHKHVERLLERAYPEEEELGESRLEYLVGRRVYEPIAAYVAQLAPTAERAKALKETLTSGVIRMPILLKGRILGALTLGVFDRDAAIGAEEVRAAGAIAQRLALAVDSWRLNHDAQRELALRRQAEDRLKGFNQELEQRVRERTSLLEEANRESNSFAYTVAHDLRAPLRAITGFCQALQEDYSGSLDPTGRDYLERIVSGARRMDELIHDLLDYARLNRAEIRRDVVDLDELVAGVLSEMESELQERKAVVRRSCPLGRVLGSGPILTQVVTNLLSNAIKFVAPGRTPEVRLYSRLRDGNLRLVIQDNGIGIAWDHRDRIFGIFERLNRAEDYPGTGIGLAIVRRAVERLGGAVGVVSKPGLGSRFWVDLPTA